MPLDRQSVQIPFAGGLDTKTDADQVGLDRLLQLENATFITPKKLRKRNGNEKLGTSRTSPQSLLTFKDELLAAAASGIAFWNVSAGAWAARVNTKEELSIKVGRGAVFSDATSVVVCADCTYDATTDQICYVWETLSSVGERTYFIKYSVVNATTGQVVVPPTTIDLSNGSGQQPKVVVFGARFVVFYRLVDRLKLASFPTNNPSHTPLVQIVFEGLYNPSDYTPTYDAAVLYGRLFTAFTVPDGTDPITGLDVLSVFQVYFEAPSSDPSVALTPHYEGRASENHYCGGSVCLFSDSDSSAKVVYLAYGGTKHTAHDDDTGTDTYKSGLCVDVFSYDLSSTLHTTHLEDATSYARPTYKYKDLIGAAAPTAGAFGLMYSELSDFNDEVLGVRYVPAMHWALVNTRVPMFYGAGIVSKPVASPKSGVLFLVSTNTVLREAASNSSSVQLDASYYLVSLSGAIVGRVFGDSATGWLVRGAVPSLVQVGDSLHAALPEQYAATEVNGRVFAQTRLSDVTLRLYDQQTSWQSVESADALHTLGGLLKMYDGSSTVEHGFNEIPDLQWMRHIADVKVVGANASYGPTTQLRIRLDANTTRTFSAHRQNDLAKAMPAWTFRAGGAPFHQLTEAQVAADLAEAITVRNHVTPFGGATWISAVAGSGSDTIAVYSSVPGVTLETNAPEGLVISTPATPTAYEYGYAACYEWYDKAGNLHRSEPAFTKVVSDQPISTANRIDPLYIRTLRMTEKSGVRVVVYRTASNGSTYYRVSVLPSVGIGDNATLLNDPTIKNLAFMDSLTDEEIQEKNPRLYTNGGELPNQPAPPATAIAFYRGRVWLVDAESPLQVWYSKQLTPSAPVEFNSALYVPVEARGGDVKALGAMDDKLIFFKANSIYAIAGQGPDSTGAGSDFSDPVLVTSDVGCSLPKSVVTTPAGLMFQSAKGIYLIDRSLQVSYIGALVEKYTLDATVLRALMVPNVNQVRFLMSSGVALVYDYFVGQWSVFTPTAGIDAAIWDGRYVWLGSDGSVYAETPGTFSDNGEWISMKVQTAWLQLAGLQGFQRAWRAMVLGEFKGPHSLEVDVDYDFTTGSTQSVVVNSESYPDDAPFQHRIHLSQGPGQGGKCEAIRFTLQDSQLPGTPVNEGLTLSGMAVEVGVKRGLMKVPASRSVG